MTKFKMLWYLPELDELVIIESITAVIPSNGMFLEVWK